MYSADVKPVTLMEPLAFELQLPWVIDETQERRFYRLLKQAALAVVVFFVIVQFLPVFTLDTDQPDIVKTTLILEPKEEPKPPEIKPEVPKPPKPKPQVKPKVPVKKVVKAVKKKPSATVKKKEKVSVVTSQGLDQLSSQLAALTGSVDTKKLRKKNTTNSERGRVAQASEEYLSKDQVTQLSGGVVVDDQVMRADVAQLSAHKMAEVEGLDLSGDISATSENYGELRQGLRDMESIRRALEAARGRVYAIYQRKLTENPDLAGKFMFSLIIEPNGTVSRLSLVDSELGIKTLEEEILHQIRQVNFGEDDVVATTVKYTFVFLPS